MLMTYMVLQYPEYKENRKILLAIPDNALTDIIIFCVFSALYIFFIYLLYNALKVRGTISFSFIETMIGLVK